MPFKLHCKGCSTSTVSTQLENGLCPACRPEPRTIFKVIIAGGRDFFDYPLLSSTMMKLLSNYMPADIEIVSGTAKGADKMGEMFADARSLKCVRFPADWDTHGKRAGYLRNEQMAEYADALVAFWDGKSRGTKHMIDIATQKGLKVRIVRY